MPDLPRLRELAGVPSSVPGLRIFNSGSLSRLGIGWPLRLVSSGLGSQVSTWLGPPYMNRKMQPFALAGK